MSKSKKSPNFNSYSPKDFIDEEWGENAAAIAFVSDHDGTFIEPCQLVVVNEERFDESGLELEQIIDLGASKVIHTYPMSIIIDVFLELTYGETQAILDRSQEALATKIDRFELKHFGDN